MSVITLPRSALIEVTDKTIKVEIPDLQSEDVKRKIAAVEATYGIWKNMDIDPVEYQRKIRAEWDERGWKNI